MSRVASSAEARRHDRVQTRLPVGYGVDGIDRTGYAESVSLGGLYINTNDVFKVGTRLIVRIDLPQGAVRQRAEVTWAIRVPEHLRERMVCGMGIAFVAPDPGWPALFRDWKRSLVG